MGTDAQHGYQVTDRQVNDHAAAGRTPDGPVRKLEVVTKHRGAITEAEAFVKGHDALGEAVSNHKLTVQMDPQTHEEIFPAPGRRQVLTSFPKAQP